MDLKRIFSVRVIGLIVLILVVLFIGAAFNANLEGMQEGGEEAVPAPAVGQPKKEPLDKMPMPTN